MKNIILLILLFIPSCCFTKITNRDSLIKNAEIITRIDTVTSTASIKRTSNNIESGNNKNFNFTAPLITFLFGILLGLFSRHTEFKKYLLQKRIDIFSDFLSTAEPCRRNALISIFTAQLDKKNFDEQKIPDLISEIYWPIILKQFHSSLILGKRQRKKFKEHIKNLSSLTIESYISDPKDVKTSEIENIFKDIEKIFEKSIDRTKSIFL